MRGTTAVLLILTCAWGPALADDEPAAPKKPKTVSTLAHIAEMAPSTTEAHIHCHAGLLPALVKRCPALTKLTITCNSKIDLAELVTLASLSKLAHLSLGGDMSFPTSHFEVVGTLKGLKSLRLRLY